MSLKPEKAQPEQAEHWTSEALLSAKEEDRNSPYSLMPYRRPDSGAPYTSSGVGAPPSPQGEGFWLGNSIQLKITSINTALPQR